MRRNVGTTAFSGAEDQAAALQQWKLRHKEHCETKKRLTSKINEHKSIARNSSKKKAWLSERDSLSSEQENCECNVTRSMDQVAHLLSRSECDMDNSGDLEVAKEVIQRSLIDLERRMKLYMSGTERDVESILEKVECLRAFLTSEMVEAAQEEEAITAETEMNDSCGIEFNSLFVSTEQRMDKLHAKLPNDDPMKAAFSSALKSEQQSAESRLRGTLGTLSANATVTPQSTLHIIGLIIKMVERSKFHTQNGLTPSGEVFDRARVAFPNMPASELHRAIQEASQQRKYASLARVVALDFKKTTNSIFSAYEAALQLRHQYSVAQKELDDESREREAQQQQRHEVVGQLREAYQEKLRLRQDEETAAQLLEESKLEVHREARLKEFQERLRQLAEYEAKKARMAEEKKRLLELEAEEERAEKATRMEVNEQRVEFRKQELLARQEARRVKEAVILELNHEKQAALERFFASVDRQIGAVADPQRILQPTVASAQTESYVTFAEAGLPERHGFTDDQVMRDPRVRLYHALLAAGLHKSQYGREVVSRGYKISPAQQLSMNNPLGGIQR